MVYLLARAIGGLKFLADPLNIKFPSASPFQALTNEKSPVIASSKTYFFPLNSRT